MSLYQQVESALKGGVTCVQHREKNCEEQDFLNEAHQLKALCHQYKKPLIINDNISVAVQCGADGVHVGQRDMAASDVRRRIGNNLILGVSVQTVEQAIEAERQGANYLGVGAVFETATKKDADLVHHKTLREISDAVRIPVVAIGGINAQNIPVLSGTGIAGVAVIRAIFASENIEEACITLKKLSEMLHRTKASD